TGKGATMHYGKAEIVVLLISTSLLLTLHLSTTRVYARKPVREPAQEVTSQSSPAWEVEELAILRQQVENQQQLTDSLQDRLKETQGTVEALTTRLDARRAVEEALMTKLQDIHQEGERLRLLLYGTIGAMVVSLGLLFSLQGRFPNYRTQTRRVLRIRE